MGGKAPKGGIFCERFNDQEAAKGKKALNREFTATQGTTGKAGERLLPKAPKHPGVATHD
jgi:hypothetical protein